MTEPKKVVLSIIIPIFNEEEGLPNLIPVILKEAEKAHPDFELIFSNDGSSDRSEAIIFEWIKKDPRIKLISLSRNFGHHPAVQAGLDSCRGQAVILMDGDFQDPPELISEIFQKWREGYEIVYTSKTSRNDPPLRRLFFDFFYRVFNLFSTFPIQPGVGVFSLMDRKALEVLRDMPERNKYLAGMRQWVGFRQFCFEFDRPSRQYGEAKQTLTKLFRLALDALFSFSRLPIRIVWFLGCLGVTFSILGTIYALMLRLILGTAILGWTSILLGILFMGGVQLICFSILGEYQIRIYDEVKQRPYYVVSRKQGFDETQELR